MKIGINALCVFVGCLVAFSCGNQQNQQTLEGGLEDDKPLLKEVKLQPDKESFYADVDFDGEEERLVTDPYGGPRGMNGYTVYEKGQNSPREDPPFDAINDWTSFNVKEKTITHSTYYGFIDNKTTQMEKLRYTRQQDGSFALTDSSMVLLRLQKDGTFVDSLRLHYHRQGEKMVLLMQEVLK